MHRARIIAPLVLLCACAEPIAPRLSVLEQRVFAPNCTFSACHSSLGHAGGLTLTRGKSFASLVGVPAEQDQAAADGLFRVAPGDELRSFLVLKLRNHLDPRYGERMPNGAETVADDELAAIEQWIRRGAPAD